MVSDKIKKERLVRMAVRVNQYSSSVNPILIGPDCPQSRRLSIVDQTPGSKEFMNFAGLVTSDITMLMRMNDETMLRSALANVKILQERGDNYGDMSKEEICAHVRPRGVQTVAEFDAWQSRLSEMDYDKLVSQLDFSKEKKDVKDE